jgi:hypothetical protein
VTPRTRRRVLRYDPVADDQLYEHGTNWIQAEPEGNESWGSPMIVINGVDPFATDGDPIGLACRMFRAEHRLEGSPAVAQIRTALMQSLDASHGPPTTNG